MQQTDLASVNGLLDRNIVRLLEGILQALCQTSVWPPQGLQPHHDQSREC